MAIPRPAGYFTDRIENLDCFKCRHPKEFAREGKASYREQQQVRNSHCGSSSLIALATSGTQLYQNLFGTLSVVVATSPAEATIKVNGRDAGKAPVTLELKRGTYTIEAAKSDYEPAQHAVFVSAKEPNLVNIQLVPVPNPQKSVPSLTGTAPNSPQADNSKLLAEVEKLKAALMSNPEEALSLPLIREKLKVQEELSKAIRDDLKEVKEQSKWYLSSMIAIVVGLLAVIATLFVGQRSKQNT